MTQDLAEAPISAQRRTPSSAWLAWLIPPGVFATFVGTLTALSQHETAVTYAAMGIPAGDPYPLTGHIVAMVLVATVAVSAAAVLVRARTFIAAAAVVLGAVLGPLTVVAVPVRGALMRSDSMDTVAWWHVVVGAVLVAIMTIWALAVARHAPAPRAPVIPVPHALLLTLATATGFLICYLTQEPDTSAVVGIVPLVGWALMAGGLTLAATHSSHRASLARLALTATAFAVMYDFYHREGGWPGVAGWEYMGMQSPLILSMSIAVVVLLATPTGSLISEALRAARRRA